MQGKILIRHCRCLYECLGVSAVIELANKLNIKTWHHCVGCDADMPVVDDDECLVCGSTTNKTKELPWPKKSGLQ